MTTPAQAIAEIREALERADMQLTSLGANNTVFVSEAIQKLHMLVSALSPEMGIKTGIKATIPIPIPIDDAARTMNSITQGVLCGWLLMSIIIIGHFAGKFW